MKILSLMAIAFSIVVFTISLGMSINELIRGGYDRYGVRRGPAIAAIAAVGCVAIIVGLGFAAAVVYSH